MDELEANLSTATLAENQTGFEADAFEQLRASADKASQLMKAMANTDRLMLLCQLSQGEKTVSELESLLNIHQPTLSQQLTVLRESQLVSTRREGKNVIYSISSSAAMAVMQALYQEICQKGT